MTPRQADIVFVLENIPGVVRVYALRWAGQGQAQPTQPTVHTAVEVMTPRDMAAAHYALLRVLKNEECEGIGFVVSGALPPHLIAEPLFLDPAEREQARSRVPPLPLATTDASPTTTPQATTLKALLIDVDESVELALRRVSRGDARHVILQDQASAAREAIENFFHIILCSERAALASGGFLQSLARADLVKAARVVVLTDARNVSALRFTLAQRGLMNDVLMLPIDETILEHRAFRDHAHLLTKHALDDVARSATPVTVVSTQRFRRLNVLVVDDDRTTEILFSSGSITENQDNADIALARTPLEALEYVAIQSTANRRRSIDLAICSASMRDETSRPFYRALWRIDPNLKSRTILIAFDDAIPPSARGSARVMTRPLGRDAIARAIEQVRDSTRRAP